MGGEKKALVIMGIAVLVFSAITIIVDFIFKVVVSLKAGC